MYIEIAETMKKLNSENLFYEVNYITIIDGWNKPLCMQPVMPSIRNHFNGTVSPVQNWLKVVSLDKPRLTQQALAIIKIINYSFKLQQGLQFLSS